MAGFAAAGRMLHRRDSIILAYHNVVPIGYPVTGDRSLHLRLDDFVAQIESLALSHDLVKIREVLEPSPRGSRPRAAITFDDAYRGAVIHAIPELARRGIPATVFVAPSFVGGRSFWWDALAATFGELPTAVRDEAIGRLAGRDRDIRTWAKSKGWALGEPGNLEVAALEDELGIAVSVPGIELASHTWSHPNLQALTAEALRIEFERSMSWLRARFPRATQPIIAYPYGRTSSTVEHAARAAGFVAGLSVEPGWVSSGGSRNPQRLGRVNIPAGITRDGFVLRTSGVL